MTPKEASRKENENKVQRNLCPEFGGKFFTPTLSIGDNVGITKKKRKHLIKAIFKGGRKRFLKYL